MTMQKGRQNQYLRPDSPPSNLKKSPLAMLVETCSSIGQELTKTTKPADIAIQLDGRKKSPSNLSKPCSPNNRPSPTMPLHRGVKANGNIYSSATAANQISSLTAQYQLMYQQLLYQAELDYQRANTKPTVGAAPAPLKPLCAMCSLTPGYNGHCIHTTTDSSAASTINPAMLAMLNPAAALTYSKLMGLSTESALSSSQQGLVRRSSVSPPSAHDSRRSSASSNHTVSPPSHLIRDAQPMDLARQRSPSPLPQKECHWVNAEGYCGKRFHSQDDLMSHLKYHVITCPNVPSEKSRSPLKSYRDSNFNTNTSSNVLSKHRFNPYGLPEKHLTAAMLRH